MLSQSASALPPGKSARAVPPSGMKSVSWTKTGITNAVCYGGQRVAGRQHNLDVQLADRKPLAVFKETAPLRAVGRAHPSML